VDKAYNTGIGHEARGNGGRRMKHYTTEEWVDFVNQKVDLEQSKNMQAHLHGGCQKCSNTELLWKRVRQAAARESEMQVPESVLQHLRNAFVVMAQPKKRGQLFAIPRLIFDSVWGIAAAGVRATTMSSRQLLYQAGNIVIEMRIEAKPSSGLVQLEGQIMDTVLKGKGIGQVPVRLMNAQAKVTETSTSDFGEFHLEYEAAKHLQVAFAISAKEDIFIPLDESLWRSGARTS
jgi:hypothetical protein